MLRTNDVLYRRRKKLIEKPRVVHPNQLAPFFDIMQKKVTGTPKYAKVKNISVPD